MSGGVFLTKRKLINKTTLEKYNQKPDDLYQLKNHMWQFCAAS